LKNISVFAFQANTAGRSAHFKLSSDSANQTPLSRQSEACFLPLQEDPFFGAEFPIDDGELFYSRLKAPWRGVCYTFNWS
jgi:hypothetical protein